MYKLTGVFALALLVIGMVGCEKPDAELSDIKRGGGSGSATTPKANNPQTPTEEPGEEKDPEAQRAAEVADSIKKFAAQDTEALEIKDDPEHWREADVASKPVAMSLGAKIDDGFAALPPTIVEVALEIVDRKSVLKSVPKVRIQDEKNFLIEFTSTESQGSTNSFTADGTKRALFKDGKVTPLAPFDKQETRVKLNRAEIEEFARKMPAEGFRYYSYGDRPWSAFVSGLQDPKNNFEVQIKEMDANPIGDTRKFYRLVAHSKKGNEFDIELVVDTKRNVPVVFRSSEKYSDGETRQLVWKAKWSFGGIFEKGEFKIPMQKK